MELLQVIDHEFLAAGMRLKQYCAFIAATFLFQLAGCSDPVLPSGGIEGVYALVAVNGRASPATVAEGGGQQYVLLADTLRFSRAGTAVRSSSYRHLSSTFTPPDTVYNQVLVLPYTLDRGKLTLGAREYCPPNANCMGWDEGVMSSGELTLVGRMQWSGDPILSFRRIAQH